MLSREDFFKAGATTHEWKEFDIPRLGKVGIRTLMAEEREEYRNKVIQQSDPETGLLKSYRGLTGWLLVRVLCDASGERILQDGDESKVMSFASDVIDELADAARKFTGITKDHAEEAEKNSEPTPS